MAEYESPQREWIAEDRPGTPAATQNGFAHAYGVPQIDGDPPPPRPLRRYDLRPLTTGEILDRTFTLFRAHFWLFAGLSAMAASITVIISVIQRAVMQNPAAIIANTKADVGGLTFGQTSVFWLLSVVGGIASFLAYSITNAATVSAVSALYLERETSIPIALRSVQRYWFRYPLIALWQVWSMIWVFVVLSIPAIFMFTLASAGLSVVGGMLLFLAFASIFYGIVASLRNSLAVAASVVEELPVRAAMKRSKILSSGTKWRIFLMILLLGAMYLVVGVVQTPFAFLILRPEPAMHIIAEAITMLITFLTGALIGPIGAIALCLFYIDQRVRKEAFDIEFLMSKSAPPAPSIPATPSTELA